MTTSAILRAAKESLTPETWYRGKGKFRIGASVCAHTAIGLVCYGIAEEMAAVRLLCRVATGVSGPTWGDWCSAVWNWNDAPERTLQDVHEAFDAAIAIAEGHERQPASEDAPEPILVTA